MAVDIQPSSAAPAPDPAATPDISGNPAGMPTASTSNVGAPAQQPQPSVLPPESVGQGIRRGMRGSGSKAGMPAVWPPLHWLLSFAVVALMAGFWPTGDGMGESNIKPSSVVIDASI
jgi:hypothetical protein